MTDINNSRIGYGMGVKNIISKEAKSKETAKHQCGFCGKVFRFKFRLNRHLNFHTREKPHQCQKCSKTYSSAGNLKIHIQVFHIRKYVCPVPSCGLSLANAGSLDKHTKVVHDPKSYMNALTPCSICKKEVKKASLYAHLRRHKIGKKHKCKTCEKSFVQASELKKHENTHFASHLQFRQLKLQSLTCKECDKSFENVAGLNCHTAGNHKNFEKENYALNSETNLSLSVNFESGDRDTQHENLQAEQTERKAKTYPCGFCEAIFTLKNSRTQHLRSHTKEKPHKCQECDKPFSKLAGLKSHIDYIHKKIKHLCPFPNCGKYLANPYSLKVHLGTHDPVAVKNSRRPCPICNQLVPKTSFHGHVSRHTHHSKTYKCDKCDKAFGTAHSLERHSSTHLPPDKKNSYLCNLCEFKTSRSSFLKRHIKFMHPVTPNELHGCSFCDKQYRNRQNLVEHLRTHTGEKPFICQECECAFISQLLLTNHIKSKHCARSELAFLFDLSEEVPY